MRVETRAVGIACGLGGLLGAFLALDISRMGGFTGYLWTVGLLVGGLVGYVVYDFRGFLTGVAQAWREVVNWRPNWRRLGAYCMAVYSSLCLLTTALVCVVLLLSLLAVSSGGTVSVKEIEDLLRLGWWLTLLFAVFLLSLMIFLPPISIFWEKDVQKVWKREREFLKFATLASPVVLPFFLPYLVGRGLVWLAKRWRAVVKIRLVVVSVTFTILWSAFEVAKRTFFYIHSRRRLLCLVDAAIGAAVGYYFGNTIVGGLAGALWGIVNYEILSVRVLHLRSAR